MDDLGQIFDRKDPSARRAEGLARRRALVASVQAALHVPAPAGEAPLAHKLKQAGAVITALEIALQTNAELQDRMERRVAGPESSVIRSEAKQLAQVALALVAAWRKGG